MNDAARFSDGPDGPMGEAPAETALARVQSLLALGRPAEALREAALALASAPEHAGLLQLASVAQGRLGRYREAMGLAQRLLAVAPQYDVAHNLYAAHRWNAGRRDRVAVQSARSAVALDPEDPDNRSLLAHMLMERRHLDEARQQLEEARQLSGSAESSAHVHALLGDLALRQRRPQEAEACARAALRLASHSDLGLRVLALAQLRARQPHEAIRTALSAVQQDPADEGRARYLRVIVGEHLPHPLGARTWRLLFLPYGIGVGVSLVTAVTLAVGNLHRWSHLPPDLREVVRAARQGGTPAERWRPWIWLGFFVVFIGGLLLIPHEATSALNWFFYLGLLVGAGLLIVFRRWR